MRTSWLLIIIALIGGVALGAEYGTRHRDVREVSLVQVLNSPASFTNKTIAVWGVIGGYKEGPTVFLTHDHARWRDMSNGIPLGAPTGMDTLKLGPRGWTSLWGKAVRLEGRLVTEQMGKNLNIMLIVNHVFVPDDDRQTGQAIEPSR